MPATAICDGTGIFDQFLEVKAVFLFLEFKIFAFLGGEEVMQGRIVH
jgi:hypothetical protein